MTITTTITTTRVRARFVAAIATGLAAGCHHEEAAQTVTVEPLPSATASAAASASTSPSASTSANASTSTAATQTAPPATATARAGTRCPAETKAKRLCVARRTPPDTGGNIPTPTPYTAFDKNGCYAAVAIQTSCNGIPQATGPILAGGQCCFDVCQGTPAPCGRPLLVAGRPRMAAVVARLRSDWSAAPLDLAAPLGAHDANDADDASHARSLAARAWRLDAAAEHASVASFARLSLQLLALGAPSDLVAAAHTAALEEIEHARICFGIAADLAGETAALGPAPLSLVGVRFDARLADVAREAAVQSCVGETIAALALAHAARGCAGDSPLASRLATMAEQELGHAALGWQLVAWACRTGGDDVRAAVEAALAVQRHSAGDAPALVGRAAASWRSAGRLTASEMNGVVEEARAVVGEAQRALFATATA